MRRVRIFFALTSIVSILLTQSAAGSPSSIGLYFNSDATDCDAGIAVGSPFEVHVVARLGTDAGSNGIQGALFRITGFEPSWMPTFTPNPQADLVIGDPLQCFAAIAFPVCQKTGLVSLGTIQATMMPPATPHTLRIASSCDPSDPDYPFYLVLCDAPVYTKLPCLAGEAFLNGGTCSVATIPTTWTTVRELFRSERAEAAATGSK